MGPHYTLEEQETVIRFDRTPADAMLYTAAPAEAAKWRKLGYNVQSADAHGWKASIPKGAVKFRKLVNGILPKKAVSAAFLASRRKAKAPNGDQGA